MKQILLTLKDGVIVGASMLLPGISGGTMAIILGIYDTLIRSISSLRKNLKKSLLVLIPFCIGAGLGIVLLSKWVLEAVNLFPVPMHYLFIGVIIGSIPALYQKANIRKFHPLYLLWASIGVAAMVGLAFIPEGLFAFESNEVSVGMFFSFAGGRTFGFYRPDSSRYQCITYAVNSGHL